MASNFLKALGDANLSVTTSRNGSRVIGGNAAMDREDSDRSGEYRGRSRGRGWSRGGGRYNNRRGGRNNNRGGRYNKVTPYSRFQQEDNDGDDSMAGASHSNFRYKPYRGRQNQNRPYGNREGGSDYIEPSNSKWFKISVPGGKNHEKAWLTSKLKGSIDEPFEPVEFHYMGDTACFFVDDKNVADKLKSKSHRITCRDGSKIVIHVRSSGPPRFSGRAGKDGGPITSSQPGPSKVLDEETEQILMQCLAQRFIAETNSVNLNNLMEDATLSGNNIQGNLNKPWLMPALIDVISKVSPGLVGLDISGNHIRNLDLLRYIPGKLPNLEILSLKDNEIQSLEELVKIKSVKSLKHLFISGNPACIKYQSNGESLLRDVRSKLETIETLDGIKLPPPILFDVPSASTLPDVKVHYVPNPQMQQKIIQFIQQYFQHYDEDDRQGLLEFYHDKAIFSMCLNSNVYSKEANRERSQPLNDYFPLSRNLKRLRDKGKKASLIKSTKLAAVAFLNELPRTKHDLQSFGLDVSTDTPSFVCFTVRGSFLEGVVRDIPRAFSRTFILLLSPDNSMKIMNDQLHIRNSIRVTSKATPTSLTPRISNPISDVLSTDKQQELVKKFSEASKMNAKFSLQCLKQNNWDFQKAGEDFTGLQRDGKIPPEAFLP